jgi:putative PIG3 family NAD(P)H quinone oxidoreductase
MKTWASGKAEEIIELPVPKRRPGWALLRVKAAGVNRADLLQRRGLYPPPSGEPETLGLECSGIVEEADETSAWRLGDRVCVLLAGGGYAEFVTAPDSLLLPLPDSMTFEEAASLPEALFTSYFNLIELARATSPTAVLIHAGASGVGTMAIQLCKLFGHRVATTVGSDAKRECVASLGADRIIDYREEPFVDAVKSWSGNVSVILDCVGGSYLEENVQCLSFGGTLIIIGLLGGSEARVDLGGWLNRNVRIIASTLRNQSVDVKSGLADAVRRTIWPHFASGRLYPVIDSVFPISRWPEAHERMRNNRNCGKIVLTI